MGNFLSGNTNCNRRIRTLDRLPVLEVGKVLTECAKRKGLKEPGQITSIGYKFKDGSIIDVNVITQPRHFGGIQLYWKCPVCSSKCRKLRVLGNTLGCQKCVRLLGAYRYASQRAGHIEQANEQLKRIAERMYPGGSDIWLESLAFNFDPPEKPPGMHWKTYRKLANEWCVAVQPIRKQLFDLLGRCGS